MSIPFLYINIIGLLVYTLLFFIFLAAKKTKEVYAFLLMMVDCVVWTCGAVLMRLQVWPSMNFWYYVSLVAIFSMELVFYNFLRSMTHGSSKLLMALFTIGTLALIPGTLKGYFLPPPTPVLQPNGTLVYVYDTVVLHMVYPCLLFIAIIAASIKLLQSMRRHQGSYSSGMWILFFGGLINLVGNLMQIFIPGNLFPFDALAGTIFAIMMVFALYRRRLFHMTLVISRGFLLVMEALLCVLMGAFCIIPLFRLLNNSFGLNFEASTAVISVLMAMLLAGSYALIRRLVDTLFTREEQQDRLLKSFSSEVAQTLSTNDIMEKMATTLARELPLSQIYICLSGPEGYEARYSSNPLIPASFTVDRESPKLHYLKEESPTLIVREYNATTHAISEWADERSLFSRLQIDCIGAIKAGQDIEGLVLLSARDHRRTFSTREISFLETVCSIASIAIKNAGLYEKVFREARVDSLTGAFNYRYFMEILDEQFRLHGKDCLTLMYIDVDDFKLYNQLYGVKEGDQALIRMHEAISLCAGENPMLFRTSGKVFTLLLPGTDSHQAMNIAKEIRHRIAQINSSPDRHRFKPLSVSIGICSAPHAASSVNELMDNADLATYNSKQSGKDQITVFQGPSGTMPVHLAERTESIIGQMETAGEEYRSALAMISSLTAAIDAKDHYTFDHSNNVARYAATLAVAAGLNESQVRSIYMAGLLHDIGKISIPEAILSKSGKLTDEEYQLMRDHVNNSIEMIRHLPGMDYVIPAVLGHHERMDGKGYPRGIVGDAIPIAARCLSIADVFDAMTTCRPYRKSMSLDYATGELERGAGTQFDTDLALLFVQLIRSREIVMPAGYNPEG